MYIYPESWSNSGRKLGYISYVLWIYRQGKRTIHWYVYVQTYAREGRNLLNEPNNADAKSSLSKCYYTSLCQYSLIFFNAELYSDKLRNKGRLQ